MNKIISMTMTRGNSIILTALLAASACSSGTVERGASKRDVGPLPASPSMEKVQVFTSTVPMTGTVEPLVVPAQAPAVAISIPPVIEPATFSGWMKRGGERFGSSDNAGALADYEKAVQARPSSFRAQIQLGRTLISLNRPTFAREHVEAAIELDGASSLAWNTMGRIELSEHNKEAAISSFERSAQENADNSYAWNNLGFVLIEEGLYEQAVSALEEATSGSAPKPYMWNNLGMAYEHLDEIILARAAYRQAGDGGSERALANFHRLEGVISLLSSADEDRESLEGEPDEGVLSAEEENTVEGSDVLAVIDGSSPMQMPVP